MNVIRTRKNQNNIRAWFYARFYAWFYARDDLHANRKLDTFVKVILVECARFSLQNPKRNFVPIYLKAGNSVFFRVTSSMCDVTTCNLVRTHRSLVNYFVEFDDVNERIIVNKKVIKGHRK